MTMGKTTRLGKNGRLGFFTFLFVLSLASALVSASSSSPVLVVTIDGSINPASDDFLKTSLEEAQKREARLLILELNTPGGLLTSMQTMVESILESPIPVVVYVTPSGGSATSAGVFITLSGHFAVMAPGTTIGAAHPVQGTGQDVDGDMRAKVENFAVSLVKAVAEQRGRNAVWAEKAVRESVSITDREALDENVIDFIASDIKKILEEIEGRTVTIQGKPMTLQDLAEAPLERLEMSFKQKVVNVLSDPNIAILLGLGALLGIGIELYHPGAMLPGVVGVICLVLSLTAAQVLPINYGGVALLLLGAVFFVVELLVPSFGLWGISGVVCFVLGSIYVIDTDMVWGVGSFEVDKALVGSVAGVVGLLLLLACYLVVKSSKRRIETGKEGLIGRIAMVKTPFEKNEGKDSARGKVHVMGELWHAEISSVSSQLPSPGESVRIKDIERGMTLIVEQEIGD